MIDRGDGGWMKVEFNIISEKNEVIYNIISFFSHNGSS